MDKTNRIAIVGAGVAGMALAICATQQGYQVDLYERNRGISTLGAGVTLWSNALFVLQQMGLHKEVEKVAGVPNLMCQFDQTGRKLAELDIDEVSRLSGFSSVTILRRDLMRVLAKALAELGVKIHFNASIESHDIEALKQDYWLVVGADGRMNSVVRKAIYDDKVTPCYQGFINIIGISAWKENDNSISDFRGLGERFGIVPVKADLCYWAAGWQTPCDKDMPLSVYYQEMHRRFESWPEPVKKVLKSYDKSTLNHIFVHDIDPLPHWHKENVVIIGDAAHAPLPTSGQGACQALEDAWHLVQCLAKQTALEKVLSDFYQKRIEKTSAAQRVGRQLAQTLFTSGSGAVSQAGPANISAQQLSAFWMQGLGSKAVLKI
jgi:2-polyprenyl-6-methoxyphenol hydroxylase-like FAD-dependent oxidoreductase